MAELACLVRNGELCYDENGNALTKVAVAVNDPTSLRVDRIARAFDVRVFRAEVGEANVVSLARNLRQEGYLVRILGEGSAGGVIIHPSAVRDPLDTLGAVVKLLALRENDRGNVERAAPFKIWCERSNQNALYREDFSLADIIVSLPACATTGAYEENALLKISTSDHALLKARYQKIFLREWEEKKEMFRKRYGISKWEARAYNGTKETRGISQFACAERGGLKIIFSGTVRGTEEELAFIWIRGSATEPVFRVMADAVDRVAQVDQTDQNDKEEKSLTFAGNAQELEQFLINWQRAMTLEADSAES
jgi:phosphoglucomutase